MEFVYETGNFEYEHYIKTLNYSFILKFLKDSATFKNVKLFIKTDETKKVESMLYYNLVTMNIPLTNFCVKQDYIWIVKINLVTLFHYKKYSF